MCWTGAYVLGGSAALLAGLGGSEAYRSAALQPALLERRIQACGVGASRRRA